MLVATHYTVSLDIGKGVYVGGTKTRLCVLNAVF